MGHADCSARLKILFTKGSTLMHLHTTSNFKVNRVPFENVHSPIVCVVGVCACVFTSVCVCVRCVCVLIRVARVSMSACASTEQDAARSAVPHGGADGGGAGGGGEAAGGEGGAEGEAGRPAGQTQGEGDGGEGTAVQCTVVVVLKLWLQSQHGVS